MLYNETNRGKYMKKFNALSNLEAFLIILLAILVYLYTRQVGGEALEKESYKTTAANAYSMLSKASPQNTGIDSFAGRFSNESSIIEHIGNSSKMLKFCHSAKTGGCWSDTWLWNEKEKPGTQLRSLQFILVDFVAKDCSYSTNIPNTCAFVYVDTNGAKKPNEVGKDILLFYMTRNGFIPAGTQIDTVTKGSDCDIKNNRYNWGCTAQLLGLK